MDLVPIRYTFEEYRKITKGIVGCLVTMSIDDIRDIKFKSSYGAGVVLDHRRYHGEIHIKVGWFSSPYILFKEERKIGWHNYSTLRLISYKEKLKSWL